MQRRYTIIDDDRMVMNHDMTRWIFMGMLIILIPSIVVLSIANCVTTVKENKIYSLR